ncbi:ADP-ribosylglycohydrolase family protein [Streptomyces sp. NPDC056600]|uniref:ADP-ribosylglycohydrolase family protein n=1 Tax=Streptomyces sp. NPDC056600 TaxID=3345874 RepID=UPI0036B3ABC0
MTTPPPSPPVAAASPALDSLEGLALGDAFGERWFPRFHGGQHMAAAALRERRTPEGPVPWRWTDDTALALALFGVVRSTGAVHQELLAEAFGVIYLDDQYRGYGYGMHQLLPRLAERPARWRAEAQAMFDGRGSLGNGAAMRVAPLGAWFHDDVEEAAEQAVLSAKVTHTHPEAVAGAVAVAVAAALFAASRGRAAPEPSRLLAEVVGRTPDGAVRDGLLEAARLPAGTSAADAAEILGSGEKISAADTVPFAVWSATRHADDLTEALWHTAEGFGDVDTTCAVVGGIVAARTGVGDAPADWRGRREPLPAWVYEGGEEQADGAAEADRNGKGRTS